MGKQPSYAGQEQNKKDNIVTCLDVREDRGQNRGHGKMSFFFFQLPAITNTDSSTYAIELLAPNPGMECPFTPGKLDASLHTDEYHTVPGSDQVTMAI